MPGAATFSEGKNDAASSANEPVDAGVPSRLLRLSGLLLKNILFWGSLLLTGYGLFSVANLAMTG